MKRSYAHTANTNNMSYNPEDMRKIYNFPPANNSNAVIAVLSFGGGLFGTLDENNKLLSGDVIDYARSINITPTVYVNTLDGGENLPVEGDSSTQENTIDVIQIIASCPSNQLTIHLFIGSSNSTFTTMMHQILYINPTIVSISWGIPEYFIPDDAVESDKLFKYARLQGINICAASGDNGSSDGTNVNMCDFPSSSPNVIACGGTTLRCPNKVYNKNTIETAWSSGGGGISNLFNKPAYQSKLIKYKRRSTPDIAMNADPATGVVYQVNGKKIIIGGTSIVAPSMAGYIACLNIKTSILPKLYFSPKNSFHDINIGQNGAYRSYNGYDNCTGLGSINGVLLKKNMFPVKRPVYTSFKLSIYDKVKLTSRNMSDVKMKGSSITIHNNMLYARKIGTTQISFMSGKQHHICLLKVIPLKMVI